MISALGAPIQHETGYLFKWTSRRSGTGVARDLVLGRKRRWLVHQPPTPSRSSYLTLKNESSTDWAVRRGCEKRSTTRGSLASRTTGRHGDPHMKEPRQGQRERRQAETAQTHWSTIPTRIRMPVMRTRLHLLLTVVCCAVAPAMAQPNMAEQVYESDLAICNGGQMSAPARDACVREAGRRRDAARGGPPPEIPVATPDGRATVVTPEGSTPPPTSADAVPSRDGRANVVPAR